MKKQNLTKFALSLVCAAVLSACGGSDNAAPTTTAPTAEEAQANAINALLEKAKASNTANTLGLTEDQLKAFAKANYAKEFADDAALKAALAEFLANATKPAATANINNRVELDKTFTNFQIARNNKSNVGLDSTDKTSSDTISYSVGAVTLHKSFDTIVVATPNKDAGGKTAYLEDFQFNGTQNANAFATEVSNQLDTLNQEIFTSTFTTKSGAAANFGEWYKAFQELKTDLDQKVTTTSTDKTSAEYKKAVAASELYNLYDKAIKDAKFEDNLELSTTPATPGFANAQKLFEAIANSAISKDTNTPTNAALAILEKQGTSPSADNGRDTGELKLNGIYVDKTSTKNTTTRTEIEAETETATIGENEGKALVYQNDRRVYITAETAAKAGTDFGYVDVSGKNNNVRVLADTVAEVYGNKTFTYEVGAGTVDKYDQVNDGGNNLPLYTYDPKAGTIAGTRLNHVQYGRVTSKLHNVEPASLKDGLKQGKFETLVASYGSYGKDGTENHYFSRGSDHVSAEQVAALGNTGTLTYSGHAVSYGLDNSYDGDNTSSVPNAIGASYKLFSGNHVRADIDLASKTVTGSIYNNWTTGKREADGTLPVKDVALVTFNGKLENNGNITGTSALAYGDKSAGSFHAALYGQQAQEMGGAVQSEDYTNGKAWGAVFGAALKKDAEKPAAGSPWDPRNEVRQ